MDFWKKVSRSDLSFSWEGTCKRPEALITKSLELKYSSRSSLPYMLLSDKGVEKTKKTQEKKSAVEGKIRKTTGH